MELVFYSEKSGHAAFFVREASALDIRARKTYKKVKLKQVRR